MFFKKSKDREIEKNDETLTKNENEEVKTKKKMKP